jgi:hypothetical protein
LPCRYRKTVDEIRHRRKLVVAMAARKRRHKGVLDRQRCVLALAVPIVAIGAIAGEDLDAETRTRSRFLLGSLSAPVLHFAAIESHAGIVVEWEGVSMSL